MTSAKAEQMIRLSALVVAGLYAYRRFTEGTAAELGRSRKLAPLGTFVLGWGATFMILSILAPGLPGFAGAMALLVMIASLLHNGVQISRDLQAGLDKPVADREKSLGRRRGPRGPAGGTTVQPPNNGTDVSSV